MRILAALVMIAGCGDSKLTDEEIHQKVICADDWYDGARPEVPRQDGTARCDAVCASTADFFVSGCEVSDSAGVPSVACPATNPPDQVGNEVVLSDGTHGCCYPLGPGMNGVDEVRFFRCE